MEMGVCLVTLLAPAARPPRRATAPEHGGISRPLPASGCQQPKAGREEDSELLLSRSP